MVKIELANTQEAHEAGAHLREIALVNGLGLPESVAQDQVAGALSVVARNRLGLCVATARLEPVVLVDGVATAQVARVAVHPALRGAGVGRALIDAARSHAHQLGANRLTVQAQVDAVPFFRRLGMKPVAEPFVALGIPHQAMALDLAG
jgi:predicted GNAT family N-acyltransferase